MSILAALLGKDNPAAQWAMQNRGWKSAIGAGLAAGPTFEQGLANAAQMGPQGQMADDAYRVAEEEKAARAAQINQTAQYLANTFPDLAEAVNAGMPLDSAWNEAMKRSQPGYGAVDTLQPIEINGQLVDPVTYQVLGDFRTPEAPKTPSMPTSYQEFLLAKENPEYGAQLNSSTSKPPTEGQRRNTQLATVAEPLLKTVEENWSSLTNPTDQAIGFNTPVGAPGFAMTSPGFQKAQNAIRTIAQSYLYSVSGAAATDAETQKIVESVTPKFGESQASAEEKKKMLRRMVESIKAAGGDSKSPWAEAVAPAATNVDDILTKYGL